MNEITILEQQVATAAQTEWQLTGQPAGGQAVSSSAPTLKVIVAVHGVGDQLRCETVRAVAERLALDRSPRLPLLPLGHFNVAKGEEIGISRLLPPADGWRTDERQNIYFAEVYWANIPRSLAKDAQTLEEAKAWGRSVVSRAHALYDRKGRGDRKERGDLKPEDFDLAAGAVEEVVEALSVLEQLLGVLARAGIFKFNLAPLLRDYVGDVQVVADFQQYRDAIVSRFSDVLAQVDAALENAAVLAAANSAGTWSKDDVKREIHIVAHSEGTVVSFLGLLHALTASFGKQAREGSPDPNAAWITRVRGFMTIGSPIDKHIVLWPELWSAFEDVQVPEEMRIPWRNYYDYGDPVGFMLDSARDWMGQRKIRAFSFGDEDDFGFARYVLPGQAHVAYWKDKGVFGHFIDNVVLRNGNTEKPKDRPIAKCISAPIPYLLSLTFHSAGVYLLYKAIAGWMDKNFVTTTETFINVFVLTCLLCGVTFAARLPRLVNRRRLKWWGAAAGGFVLGAAPIWFWAHGHDVPAFARLRDVGPLEPTTWLLLLTVVPASSGWWAPRKPRRGRRWLVSLGALEASVLTVLSMTSVKGATPLWPVLLASLAFVYAWWLGILTFDLAFLWHRYVRHSVTQTALRRWR